VPDLVLVRARRLPIRRVVVALRLPLLAGALVAVGIVTGDVDMMVLVAFLAMSVAIGVESRPSTGVLVAPIVATVVLSVAVVVGGDDATIVAVLVALGSVGAARLTPRRPRGATGTVALVLAAVAAVACVSVYRALDHAPSERAVVAAVLAGVAFQLVVVTVGSRPRGPELARVGWSLPLVAVASALAVAWAAAGARPGALLFAVALGGALAAVVWWGAPPWTSRALVDAVDRVRGRRVALAATAIMAVAAAMAVTVATGAGATRTVVVMLVLAGAEAVVAMAAVAVRQWRFAPRRRALDVTVLSVAGCGLLVGYPMLALDASAWSVVMLAALLAPTLIVAWPLGGLAARRAPRTGPESQRMPKRRNASA